jgi:hypothetical protein
MKRKGFLQGLAALLGFAAFPGRPTPTTLPVQAVPPPPAIPAVHIINQSGEIYGVVWKEAVNSMRDLPTYAEEGEARCVLDDDSAYIATVAGWVQLSAASDT